MAPAQENGGRQPEPEPSTIPRHLLTLFLLVTIVFLVVGLLRLTSRVTALELRLDSLVVTRQVQPAPGPPPDAEELDPEASGSQGSSGSPRSARSPSRDKALPKASSRSGSTASSSGSDRGGEAGLLEVGDLESERRNSALERHPTAGQSRAMHQRMQQRLDDYVYENQFDDEVSGALFDDLDRSHEAHQEVHEQIEAGEMNDEELRTFLQDDLATTVDNVFQTLGKEDGLEYLENVLGIPEHEVEMINVPHVEDEPPPEE